MISEFTEAIANLTTSDCQVIHTDKKVVLSRNASEKKKGGGGGEKNLLLFSVNLVTL